MSTIEATLVEHGLPEPPKRYRAVSPLGVLSVVFGAASILLFFHWSLIVLPLLGLLLGWLALRRLARGDDLTGAGLAMGGIALSVVMGGVGGTLYYFTSRHEVPVGYKVVTFTDLQPDPANPTEPLPPLVDDLEGEKVFFRGYIYPGRQVIGLKRFILVPSQSHCSFCTRQLRSTEMMQIEMAGDLTANYTSRAVGVGGRLRIDRAAAAFPYGTFPYRLECDYVR